MNPNIRIYTHDRIFHADDAMAAAVLRMAFKDVEVIRTRDPAVLRAEAGQPGSFFVDVGGVYDPVKRLFDHHQPSGAGFRNIEALEWPYASAGLVWKEYGRAAVNSVLPALDGKAVSEIAQHIDDSVIKYIDAVDCGVRVRTAGPSLSKLFASFNPSWYEKEEDSFPLVMQLAQVVLTNFIKRYAGKVMARDKVRCAERVMGGQVLMLDTCLPWATVVGEEMPDVRLVVYPVNSEGAGTFQWQLRAAVNADMTLRLKLPASWAGLEGSSLADASNESTAVFCHRSRHLAGALTKAGAMSMAQAALMSESEFLAA
ncbi:MYG1 family protein [Paraburkholderia aspalathi]|nr:MYG1 family protein [Paraburkholderia aspalathi]MBK3779867.1 MYG1 family protein [Paraburkholderia aspalathi]